MNVQAFQHRRQWLALLLGMGALRASGLARAANVLSELTQSDAAGGLRVALERGCGAAVDLLGKDGGFWNNERVRIPLPDWLHKGESLLRMAGRGKDVDDLHLGINHAAEQAVPASRDLLVGAVHNMTVDDAKEIIRGGDDAGTRFFESKTRTGLQTRFLPIVSDTTAHLGLAQRYDRLVAQAAKFGAVDSSKARLEPFVTGKALDGLFMMIADEERKIRADPVATGSALLQKVFGH